jgi:hypothetical protein
VTWLSVVNWDKYQDIRVDDPFYVKLHICILDDKKVQALDPHPRLLWYQLLPLAGRYQNAIPYNVSAIAKEAKLERHTVGKSLQNLLNVGLLRETLTPRRPGRKAPRRTGFRLVRGSHSSTYLRDPNGTDRPPREFFASMKGR